MPTFDPKNVPLLVHAVTQVLGAEHQITGLVRSAQIEPERAAEAWRMIEELPQDHRRAIAGIFAVNAMPGVFGQDEE